MTDNSHLQVYHRTLETQISGSRAASFVFMIVGAGCALLGFYGLIIGHGLGLFLLLGSGLIFGTALLIGPRYQIIDYCDACGEKIGPTTRTCPHCRAQILEPPLKWWERTNVVLGLVLLALVGFLVISAFIH